MGYQVAAKRYRITLEDYPGVEIVARSVSLATMMAIDRAGARMAEDEAEATDAALGPFVQAIESWNLEDESGAPLPISLASLLGLPDPQLGLQAFRAWREQQTAVPDGSPLPHPSNGGAPSPGVSIPMVPL